MDETNKEKTLAEAISQIETLTADKTKLDSDLCFIYQVGLYLVYLYYLSIFRILDMKMLRGCAFYLLSLFYYIE